MIGTLNRYLLKFFGVAICIDRKYGFPIPVLMTAPALREFAEKASKSLSGSLTISVDDEKKVFHGSPEGFREE